MDNSKLEQKLELRRHFLKAYHPRPADRQVFDAFQARGVLWSTLRKEFELASYWGVDVLEKKGRIKIDSSRVLAQTGWTATIIDLDAYGSPWAHYQNALRTAAQSLTVFLTLGSRKGIQRRALTRLEKKVFRIPFWIPPAIGGALSQISDQWMLGQACERFIIREALEALPFTTARYFGLRLELKDNAAAARPDEFRKSL